MTADTVAEAVATPGLRQPHAGLGLTDAEYASIAAQLGRRPTDSELAIYSVMWSEHCSYKSSRKYLRQFGEKAPASTALLAGIGQNAGVVDVGQGYAVTFKIESHNHPSYVEPFQGAATGVGGIVRDILAMGARPVAVMDALRFGPADAADTRRVLPGVVGGISFYGNCLGLPNIGGELAFDPCYAGNPLVNALCLGVMRHADLKLARATGPGNKVVLFGSPTGPDGIGGASVLASASFGAAAGGGERAKRPSVQVGDPFMEKLLIECCLELYAAGLVVAVQDLGAAGIACATTELAAAGEVGMSVRLDAVPLRDRGLSPPEILMSESQERMMAVTAPEDLDKFLGICARWDVPVAVIGEVTGTGRLEMSWRGDVVVDIPPATAAEGPLYDRPLRRPDSQDLLRSDDPARLTGQCPVAGERLRADLLAVLGSAAGADKAWVTEQYDKDVRGNTVLAAPHDAGVLRIDEDTHLGVAIATDGNGRFCQLDPYAGTQLALAEAYRNVAAAGARPIAVTNCLNFGSPEDPAVMWQFAEAVRGLADGCLALGIPVTGGNVSFYNQTGAAAIQPTPVVGVLGVLGDVRRRLPSGFGAAGETIMLLGRTAAELGGSLWAAEVHGHLGGVPPAVDLAAEQRLAAVLAAAAARGLLSAAHDLSEGGLALALAECCLTGGTRAGRADGAAGTGCVVSLPAGAGEPDPLTALFSESAARAIAVLRPGTEAEFTGLCAANEVPASRLGLTGGDELEITGLFTVPTAELSAVSRRTLPSLFGQR
ncbi:MAG TPA: phosphoribosylformylglycinamidine synthase subunit PurL [Streptosporangiaceae bacterium]